MKSAEARESKNTLTLQSLRTRTSHREPVARGIGGVGRGLWLLKRTTQHLPILVLAEKVSALRTMFESLGIIAATW